MVIFLVLLLSLPSPSAYAGPRDCADFFVRQVRRLLGRFDDQIQPREAPSSYHAHLARDTASVREAFEALPAGEFKMRLAMRELGRIDTELSKLAKLSSVPTDEAWRKIDLKERHQIYYIHLIRLYYNAEFRAVMLELPDGLIRAGARAIAAAETGEAFTVHKAFPGWFPLLIDVEPILAEKLRR